jgi:tetratricopeptide (TPR) repeat protein
MTKKFSKILSDLDKKIKEKPSKYIFYHGIAEEEITPIEFILGIELPLSYRNFLTKFNGGFICSDFLASKMALNNDVSTAEWNSLHIFSLEEMQEEYVSMSERNWRMPLTWSGVYPIIPFARTATQELLVFTQPLDENFESPVFDAFHEDPAYEWGILFNNFEEFLEQYFLLEGEVNTVSSIEAKEMADFLPGSGWKERPDEWQDPDLIMKYNFEYLKLFPYNIDAFLNIAEAMMEKKEYLSAKFYLNKALKIDPKDDYAYYVKSRILAKQKMYEEAVKAISEAIDLTDDTAFYLVMRSSYYRKMKQYVKAIEDCDNSIKADPNYSYAYYNRSEARLALKQKQQALQDMLKANELEPGNCLYLTIMSEMHLDRQEFEEAVETATKAIKVDPRFFTPYSVRERAYSLLGEYDKAAEDQIKIKEILENEEDY